ncbi:MAG: alpha/beta fold hydrolase [Phycisphaerales bacterium]
MLVRTARFWLLSLLMVLSAGVPAGCGSSFYAKLVPEDSVPRLAELKRLGGTQTRTTTLVGTTGHGGDAVLVAVHELGSPDRESAIVLIHGAFSDAQAWRFTAPLLARDAHVLTVDLPGCGDSDKPDADLTRYPGDGVYAPEALAERTLQAVSVRLAARAKAPDRVTIVGHSLGGMIAIRMFSDDGVRERHSELLSRVDRLVLIAPVDTTAHRPDPLFQEIAEASGLRVSLGLTLGIIREKCAHGTLCAITEGGHALREEADKRVEILRDPRRRRALQAMLRRAVPWVEGDPLRPDWLMMEKLEESYSRVRVPTLIVWGRRDETLPIAMGYKLASQIPGAAILPLDRAMHSPHLEDPDRCADLIREFEATGTAAGVARVPGRPAHADTPAAIADTIGP